MLWTPRELWAGETVYIVGGGSSLSSFPWGLLRNKKVLGCNSAFLLGKDVCSAVVFGDISFFIKNEAQLVEYFNSGGCIYSNVDDPSVTQAPWIRSLKRYAIGVHKDGLGMNGSTGAAAINLALILGAKRIILLGFDMHAGEDGQNNWHANGGLPRANRGLYQKFTRALTPFSKECARVFPDVKIINANDNSGLLCFPMMSMKDLFHELNSCD